MKRVAIVITTYNDPRSLGICLRSFSNQSYPHFRICIADDGSGIETRKKIESFQSLFKNSIQHFWHEDQGYRKAKVNNQVFGSLENDDVVICVDGDTFVHHRFVEDHIQAHERDSKLLFMGRRVDLGPTFTQNVSESNVLRINQGLTAGLLWSGLRGDSRNVFRSFRLAHPFLRQAFKRDRVEDLLGSNFSVSRELLFQVNGYNEDFAGYWGEDGDLFIRLRNAGARILGSKSIAIQYHLYHQQREPTLEHVQQYQDLLKNLDYRRCSNGILKDA